jgi:peptidoglycan/xylan/chitin deacetylase (PgdA/CDA1 family)
MEPGLRIASLSLDLDDKWSYMKTHGDRGWETFPSYLDVIVPRVLSLLHERNLTATVFAVGQDAAIPRNHDLLGSIAAAGHEIGNHSFHHEPWLHLYTAADIEADVSRADEHIERATGRRPVGFRAPGYSLAPTVLCVLASKGYRYDASTLPSMVAPIVRAYYFTTARFSAEQRRQRRLLGGTLRDGIRPIRPYAWRMPTGTLVEIPVTTMPGLRVPIHVSYLMGLMVLAPSLARQYFRLALEICRLTNTQPSIVLHPTDLLGREDTSDLSFIPGMGLPSARKVEFVSDVLGLLATEFTVVTVEQHAELVARTPGLLHVDASAEGAHAVRN